MDKVRLADQKDFGFLMPVVLVGSEVDGRSAYLTAAWVTRVESSPPKIAVALAPHHTNLGIEKNSEFSINVPGKDLVNKVDYCGIVSVSIKMLIKLMQLNQAILHQIQYYSAPLTDLIMQQGSSWAKHGSAGKI